MSFVSFKRSIAEKEVVIRIFKLLLLLLLPVFLCFVSLDRLEQERSICLIKNIFGFECYGCGISKAIIATLQLDFFRAYQYNRLIVLVMPLLIYLWGREIGRMVWWLRTRLMARG